MCSNFRCYKEGFLRKQALLNKGVYLTTIRHYLAYTVPVITTSWLMAPIGILQGIYAKYYGLPLTAIASVLLFSRLFDAISDPLIAYCADCYYQRTASYKPFIFLGGILFIFSSYFLYVPPVQVDEIYFMVWFILFYFAWTLFEMPHIAWAGKIAQTSEEKTKIYCFRSMGAYTGLLLFYAIPLLPIFESHAITPDTLRVSVIAAGILMFIFLTVCLATDFVTSHRLQRDSVLQSRQRELTRRKMLGQFLLSIVNNRPLLIFISAYAIITISSGMWYSLIFLYVDSYLGRGDQFAQMFLLAFAIGLLTTPVWYKLVIYLGKKITWAIANFLLIVSYIYTGFLTPGDTGFVDLAILKTIQTLGFTCTLAVAPAMLSEIIDFSNWKYRTENNALYFAIHAFVNKTTAAIATALGLGIAGWHGFDATALVHSDQSIFGITLAIVWLPSLFAALGLLLILFSPINERRHRIVRRRLDARNLNSLECSEAVVT